MNLNYFIKDILYTHQQVVVAELGAFIRSTESAKLSENKETILAPKVSFQFDASQKTTDGILANYLVQNGKISPAEAESMIADYVINLKKRFEAGESEDFDQIGTLKYDAEQAIVFAPASDSIFVPNTALAELKVTPLKEEEIVPDKKETSRKPIGIWIAIAAAIILVLVMVFPVRNYLQERKIKAQAEAKAEAEKLAKANLNDVVLEEKETIDTKEVVEPKKEINTSIKFHIVAGSFKETKNAENLKNELSKKGYSANVLPIDGEWYRVSMAGFTDRQSAEAEMKKMNAAGSKYEIWLYIIQ